MMYNCSNKTLPLKTSKLQCISAKLSIFKIVLHPGTFSFSIKSNTLVSWHAWQNPRKYIKKNLALQKYIQIYLNYGSHPDGENFSRALPVKNSATFNVSIAMSIVAIPSGYPSFPSAICELTLSFNVM